MLRIFFTTIALLVLAGLATPEPQGLFGGLRNFLGGLAPRGRGRPQQRPQQRPQRPSGGGGSCRNSEPNHSFGGQQFLVSWRLGCTSFTASEGAAYCRANGMTAVSLDSAAKEREFGSLLTRESQPYFWTGGQVNHGARSVSWPSGRTTTQHNWSSGQPNNAEGNENCLAIIVKGRPGFNDVACHHRKPVICQQ